MKKRVNIAVDPDFCFILYLISTNFDVVSGKSEFGRFEVFLFKSSTNLLTLVFVESQCKYLLRKLSVL